MKKYDAVTASVAEAADLIALGMLDEAAIADDQTSESNGSLFEHMQFILYGGKEDVKPMQNVQKKD